MGAPKIQADYDGLSEIARHFAAKAQDTNYLMQTVQRCVDELQRGAWIGRGATRFYTEMQNVVSPAMQRLRNALDEASSATTRIAQALAKHEREAGMLFMGADAGGTGMAVGVGVGAAAGGALSGIQNFFSKLIQEGRDARDGFVKAINKALGTGVGEAASKLAERFIKEGMSASKKALIGIGGALGGGVLGGAVDLAFAFINGTPIDGNMVFDQLVSGGIQGLIGLHPVGRAVLLADAGIQIVGQSAAQFAANNADWLAYGDLARAESIRQTAQRFSTALDNLSLDNRIDGIVGAIRSGVQNRDFLGAVGGVAAELSRFVVGGVGGTVAEGATLALQAGSGLVQRAGDVIGNLASGAGNVVRNLFSFAW